MYRRKLQKFHEQDRCAKASFESQPHKLNAWSKNMMNKTQTLRESKEPEKKRTKTFPIMENQKS